MSESIHEGKKPFKCSNCKEKLMDRIDLSFVTFVVPNFPKSHLKKNRLQEIVDLQQEHSNFRTNNYIGKSVEVLIEKESKKSNMQWSGRNEQNTVVVFNKEDYKIGDFVNVLIKKCTSATLIGEAINPTNK